MSNLFFLFLFKYLSNAPTEIISCQSEQENNLDPKLERTNNVPVSFPKPYIVKRVTRNAPIGDISASSVKRAVSKSSITIIQT
jgi:hypothetical protein